MWIVTIMAFEIVASLKHKFRLTFIAYPPVAAPLELRL